MDTGDARWLNRSSPSCLNSGTQRTDFFHGLLSVYGGGEKRIPPKNIPPDGSRTPSDTIGPGAEIAKKLLRVSLLTEGSPDSDGDRGDADTPDRRARNNEIPRN